MGRRREKSVNLSPETYDYLRECTRLVPIIEPENYDPYFCTLKGCAELGAKLVLRNLATRLNDRGLLHRLRPDLLEAAGFDAPPPSGKPVGEAPAGSA